MRTAQNKNLIPIFRHFGSSLQNLSRNARKSEKNVNKTFWASKNLMFCTDIKK